MPHLVTNINRMRHSTNKLLSRLADTLGASRVMNISTRVSVLVSTIIMLVAVCVVEGFNIVVSSKMNGIVASYDVIPFRNIPNTSKFVTRDLAMEEDIKALSLSISTYAKATGIARAGGEISGIELKGYGSEERVNFYGEFLVSGSLPSTTESKRQRDVIISKSLASKHSTKVGDKLEVVFLEEPPLREPFTVVGIYDTALGELDENIIITDLRNVQYVLEAESDEVTGYEIIDSKNRPNTYDKLSDIVDVKYADNLFMLLSVSDRYPQIYSWLALQESNELVIVSIMLIVIIVNMVSLLLIMLLQNIYQIGILRVMGMRNKDIKQIFLLRTLRLVSPALLVGNILALVLLNMQKHFKIIKLDPTGYSVDAVPVAFNYGDIILLNFVILIIILFSSWLTTLVIERITPTVILKYEKR